jgi:hypothetical protein
MKKLNKKIRRYLELSAVFQKSEDTIFKDVKMESATYTTLVNCSTGGPTYADSSSQLQPKEKTKSERIMSQAEKNAALADAYDEYKELQRTLTAYFNAEANL